MAHADDGYVSAVKELQRIVIELHGDGAEADPVLEDVTLWNEPCLA